MKELKRPAMNSNISGSSQPVRHSFNIKNAEFAYKNATHAKLTSKFYYRNEAENHG